MSEIHLDQMAFEEESVELLRAACQPERGSSDWTFEAYWFDPSVHIRHPVGSAIDPAMPYRIARRLRGGRDFDHSMPADWRVTAVNADHASSDPMGQDPIGTVISFTRTFPADEGYTEPST